MFASRSLPNSGAITKEKGKKNSIQPSETLLNEQYLHSKRLRANKCTSNKQLRCNHQSDHWLGQTNIKITEVHQNLCTRRLINFISNQYFLDFIDNRKHFGFSQTISALCESTIAYVLFKALLKKQWRVLKETMACYI